MANYFLIQNITHSNLKYFGVIYLGHHYDIDRKLQNLLRDEIDLVNFPSSWHGHGVCTFLFLSVPKQLLGGRYYKTDDIESNLYFTDEKQIVVSSFLSYN